MTVGYKCLHRFNLETMAHITPIYTYMRVSVRIILGHERLLMAGMGRLQLYAIEWFIGPLLSPKRSLVRHEFHRRA